MLQCRALREFVSFGFIGAAGFVVDAGVLLFMLKIMSWGLYSARAASYLCAATFTWAANRQLTFRQADRSRRFRQWGRFVAANAVGGAANLAVYAALVAQSHLAAQRPVLAVAAGSLAGLIINFTLSRRLVFR